MFITDAGSGGSVSVDYAALAAIAARIGGLLDELGGPQLGLAAMLGDQEISAALDSAERDWNGQRKRLIAFFELALSGVNSAMQAYQQSDAEIAAASRPGGVAIVGSR